MLRNYFLVAVRNLTRHRFFSAINVFGLAISMSVCLGIIMLVADQLQYDRHNEARGRIFRVNSRQINADGTPAGNDYATCPLPIGPMLVSEFSGIEKAARIRRGFGNSWMGFNEDLSVPLSGFFADPEMLEIFSYELEYGDPGSALIEPYSVVLTKKAAKKLFTQENPVGETIKVGKIGEYKVTGVIKETSRKSHIQFEALASFSTVAALEGAKVLPSNVSDWGDFTSGWVYIMADENSSKQSILHHLTSIAKTQKPDPSFSNHERFYQFYLQPLTSITPGPFLNNPIGPFMPLMFVYFFGGLALIVMITSCFNYTNLSIARALSRAREIGVRKVNGANRFQIFTQFIAEAVVLSLTALLCSLAFLLVVKPFILNLKFAQVLKWDLEGNPSVYLTFLGFSVVAGLMAGFFPAVILSGFEPLKVLKKGGSMRLFSRMTLRKSLLVFQFALSLTFVISVVVLYNQLDHFMKADHGFTMTDKFVIKLNSTSYQNLKTELSAYSSIVNVAGASHVPASGMVLGHGFKKDMTDPEFISVDYYNVDENYLDNLSIELVAGKNFDVAAGESNKKFVILNEQSVKKFAFSGAHEAVGEYIFSSEDSTRFQIIGVVRDYNHEILVAKIGPMVLKYNPDAFSIAQVKFTGDAGSASKDLERAWSRVNPTQKIDYNSFEDEVRGMYKAVFGDLVKIVGVISFLAIVISCLGLLGMATYTIETRVKEIAIRKVLGSDNASLLMLLSRGFLFLIAIAVVVAVPAAWFINNLWLEHIAYRTSLDLEVILFSVSVILALAAITVGSQTLRASNANPVNNLRNE